MHFRNAWPVAVKMLNAVKSEFFYTFAVNTASMESIEHTNVIGEILHPEVWSLAMRLSDSKIVYAIYSSMEDNSLSFGEIPFSGSEENAVKEVEAAVYDHRFFLYGYGRRAVLSDSLHFLLIPDEFSACGDYEECRKYYRYVYPDDNLTIITNRIERYGATLAFGIEPALDSFLRRTFDNPEVLHLLTPLLKFVGQKEELGTSGRMFVYFNDGMVEIAALKNGRLVCANFFKFAELSDAFYYIMNVWQTIGFDVDADEMHIFGEKRYRKALLGELRKYVRTVVQSIFPARLLRTGRNAMDAPFDLIVLPLCE